MQCVGNDILFQGQTFWHGGKRWLVVRHHPLEQKVYVCMSVLSCDAQGRGDDRVLEARYAGMTIVSRDPKNRDHVLISPTDVWWTHHDGVSRCPLDLPVGQPRTLSVLAFLKQFKG